MAHIILKLVIKRTSLLGWMFSLANLFKRGDYRSTVLKALRAELERRVADPVNADPPPEYGAQWEALFQATFLRGVRRDGGTGSKKTRARQ